MKYSSPWNIDPTLGERLIAWRREVVPVPFEEISKRLGMTRNSCIGWARRNGLANQTVSGARDPKPEPQDPEPEPMKPEPLAPTKPMRLLDTLNALRECRWPVDGCDEPMCCGAPTVEGTSWCKPHLARVMSPAPRRKDVAA